MIVSQNIWESQNSGFNCGIPPLSAAFTEVKNKLGIIKLSSDQRNFLWGSNDRPIMTVPFDEHPYTALAHWFKTDEGMEIYANIEKRLN